MTFHSKLERLFLAMPFQIDVMLAGMAGAYPSEALLKNSTLGQTPGLIHKH